MQATMTSAHLNSTRLQSEQISKKEEEKSRLLTANSKLKMKRRYFTHFIPASIVRNIDQWWWADEESLDITSYQRTATPLSAVAVDYVTTMYGRLTAVSKNGPLADGSLHVYCGWRESFVSARPNGPSVFVVRFTWDIRQQGYKGKHSNTVVLYLNNSNVSIYATINEVWRFNYSREGQRTDQTLTCPFLCRWLRLAIGFFLCVLLSAAWLVGYVIETFATYPAELIPFKP